jgi:hypothetical protein
MRRKRTQGGSKKPSKREVIATYHSGVDYFASDPAKLAKTTIKCRACGKKLTGYKSKEYGSFAAAMAKRASLYWVYRCPNVNRSGHERLVELVKEEDHLTSNALKKLVRKELSQEIRKFKKTIKKGK